MQKKENPINSTNDFIFAINLLEARLERGEYLEKQDGVWWLFEEGGDGVVIDDAKNKRSL